MSGFATSLEELNRLIVSPHKTIADHIAEVERSGGQPVQMPQVVIKQPVAPVVQQPLPKQQPTINNPQIVPPKKGGCGCWGTK